MKAIFATAVLSLFIASNASAIMAKTVSNYYCGSLKFKGEDSGPVGASTFVVTTGNQGVTVSKKTGGMVGKPGTATKMTLKRSLPEHSVWAGGDYEVEIGVLNIKGKIVKTVTLVQVSNRDWTAQCKLPVAK